jgi:hypothetical protein
MTGATTHDESRAGVSPAKRTLDRRWFATLWLGWKLGILVLPTMSYRSALRQDCASAAYPQTCSQEAVPLIFAAVAVHYQHSCELLTSYRPALTHIQAANNTF